MLASFPQILTLLAATSFLAPVEEPDLRSAYDILAYDLELAVRPESKTLEGVAVLHARVTAERLAEFQFDLYELHEVLEVRQGETPVKFKREGNSALAILARPLEAGDEIALRVHYRGQPKGKGFDGFHWAKSQDGSPWINTSCQGSGAHYWYPCKASFYHPEDKPERVSMAIVCPAALYGVSNGRLQGISDGTPDWFDAGDVAYKTYRWKHDYPLETYSVTLNVGPYEVVEQTIDAPGLEEPLAFTYFVLPENAEKAALQFAQVPELVRIFSEAFGPFPFPDSKFGLVETNFWGMEHSTAVAYGSSYPAWCEKHGEKDDYAPRNRWFDYILIHEVAHEWWGNAVSAKDWGHFWLHEGFGTYAEGVYVEGIQDRAAADRFFVEMARRISPKKGRLYRGESPTSGEAYSGLIYSKGACVLHTLRHFVDDDEAWWTSLREFNLEGRYKNSDTAQFQAILERNTGRPWKQFFDEWFLGEGTPQLKGTVRIDGMAIVLELDNSHGEFHLPLDLAWQEDGEEQRERVWLAPGMIEQRLERKALPTQLRVEHLERVLGRHQVKVVE